MVCKCTLFVLMYRFKPDAASISAAEAEKQRCFQLGWIAALQRLLDHSVEHLSIEKLCTG